MIQCNGKRLLTRAELRRVDIEWQKENFPRVISMLLELKLVGTVLSILLSKPPINVYFSVHFLNHLMTV